MAVYEQTYKRYPGPLTPEWSRFLIIPRHAYRTVFSSKLFTAYYVVCFIPVLIESIFIYLHHNVNALGIFQVNVVELIPIDASFFQTFVYIQGGFSFVVAILVGPPLVARDLRNNALPLYLCRPFSRAEYVLGKMSVLLILLSCITWVPQLLLFFFQSYLAGAAWFKDNLWIVSAIFIANFVWILLLALLSQSISSLVKWRVIASAIMLGLFIVPSAFAEFINIMFQTRWGNLFSLFALLGNTSAGLFGTFVRSTASRITVNDQTIDIVSNEPPLWCSWAALFFICAVCLMILARRVKAYEVVR
jgi:ABC-2 type transport system permease protein